MSIDEIAATVKKGFDKSDREYCGFTWFYEYHVSAVRDHAKMLAEKYEADKEVAELAALLHDIGLCHPKGSDGHEERSAEWVEDLLHEHDYDQQTINAVQQAILSQETLEGKVLDTADSLAHLKTPHFIIKAILHDDYSEFHDWMEDKLDSDLERISFEDEQQEAEAIAAFWKQRLNLW